MKEGQFTDAILRDFLLGKLDEEERDRIESVFFVDDDAHERILALEQELMDDYLDGSLTSQDRERFHLLYTQTEAQRQKLLIAESIRRHAAESDLSLESVTVGDPVVGISRSRGTVWIPVLATIVLAVVVALVWFGTRNPDPIDLEELARLNSSANLTATPGINLDIAPGATRGTDDQVTVKRTADSDIVELRLTWLQERQAKYTATIYRRVDGKSFSLQDLRPVIDGPRYFIPLKFRMRDLTRGTYQIALSGGGRSSVEYVFEVD